MKKIILLSLLGLLSSSLLSAQTTQSLVSSWLHLDKPFYVTEDALGFQLYLAPEFLAEEIVVQSILFDATGQAQLYAYWTNNGSTIVPGQLIVPADLATGWYYLSFRVWDKKRNTEKVLLQAPIAIYNDQTEISPQQVSQQEPARQTAVVAIPEKELTITPGDLPKRMGTEEEMKLSFQVTDRRGRPVLARLSISVTDWGLMGASMAMGMDNLQGGDSLRVITPAHLSGTTFWQGVHLDGDGLPQSSQPLMGMIDDQEQVISTNELGRFTWQPPVSASRSSFGFTTDNDQPARVKFAPSTGRLALGQLFYSPAAFRYLEINRQRKLINKLRSDGSMLNPEDYQNTTTAFSGPYRLVGLSKQRSLSWNYVPTASLTAAHTTLLWLPGQLTNQNGVFSINYAHPTEATTYRVDIVAQDDQGQRGRTSFYYRTE